MEISNIDRLLGNLESATKRILKIGIHLLQLCPKVKKFCFLRHSVVILRYTNSHFYGHLSAVSGLVSCIAC